MSALQQLRLFSKNSSSIKTIFNKSTLINYFVKKLTLWNQILSNDGKTINATVYHNTHLNFNLSAKPSGDRRRSNKIINRINWLSIGTATPDV